MINSIDMMIPELRFKEFKGKWTEKKLGDIATFTKGKGISKADISEDGVLECIRYGELYTHYGEVIKEIKSKTNLPKANLILSEANDVIIPASGEARLDIATASCVLKKGVALSGDLNIIKAKLDGTFLAYYLNSEKKKAIASLAQGVSVVHLYSRQLKSLNLSLPTLPEQQKIANFLTTIDTKIQQLTKKKELLEAYKKGVMQQLFSQEIRFKDKDGKIFSDWEEKRLGEFIIDYKGGAPLKPKDFTKKGGCEVIPKKAIIRGGKLNLDISQPTFCSKDFFSSYTKSVINNSYLVTTLRDLVPSGPSIGYIVNFFDNKEYILAQGVYGLKIDETKLSASFLIQLSNTIFYRRLMQTIMVGSTQVHIRTSIFFSIKLKIPSLPEQQKIANFLTALDDKIAHVGKQIAGVQAYKKGLLQQMFI